MKNEIFMNTLSAYINCKLHYAQIIKQIIKYDIIIVCKNLVYKEILFMREIILYLAE